MPVAAMIEVEDVTKLFGATRALDHVSLSVGAGRVLALLGPNGAGKTTLVRVLTTLLRPDSGQARVAGLDVTAHAQADVHIEIQEIPGGTRYAWRVPLDRPLSAAGR